VATTAVVVITMVRSLRRRRLNLAGVGTGDEP